MALSRVVDAVLSRLEQRDRRKDFFKDPAAWVEYMLGDKMWSAQRKASVSVVEHHSTVVKASHGVGKSWWAATLICWWIDTRYPQVFVASTAPSVKQVNAIVWREVRRMKRTIEERFKEGVIDHKLPGYITSDAEWKDYDGTILGFGRKPPDNKEEDVFQGIHDGAVLAIGDEAVGLSADMIDALGNITTNSASRRVLICNPTNPNTYVGKIFREDVANWSKHTISAFDSPNFTDERNEMPQEALDRLVDQSYVDSKKVEYGENSPRYKARVLGEFAYDLGDTLIKPEDVADAYNTEIVPSGDAHRILGVDVARFGPDSSVIFSNVGGQIRFVGELGGETRTTEVAAWVHRHAVDFAANEVRVDADGVGGGVVDSLMALNPRYTVIEVHGNASSPDRRQWYNWRAYSWDMLRRGLRDGTFDLDSEDEHAERLYDELVGVEYRFHGGSVLLESKDDMRKRGVKSPDFADAAVYASMTFSSDPLLGFTSGDKYHTNATDILDDVPSYLRVLGGF